MAKDTISGTLIAAAGMPRRTQLTPSTVIAGSSMVRKVKVPNARILCYPGARVKDLIAVFPTIIKQLPNIERFVIHIGSNDVMDRNSQSLKKDFINLLGLIQEVGMLPVVSGPIPSLRIEGEKFCRLWSLHVWLQNYCQDNGFPFADNFDSFWGKYELFSRDRCHPNEKGAHLLSSHIDLLLNNIS